LTKERDQQLNLIVSLRNEISDIMQRIRTLEAEKTEGEHEIHTLKDLIATKKSEADREQRNKDKLERELKECRAIIESKNAEVRSKQDLVNKTKEDIVKMEQHIKEQKAALDKAQKDQEILLTRSVKLQEDFEEQIIATTSMLSENQQKTTELKFKEEEILKIREEIKNVNKVKEALTRKIKVLEDQKMEAEAARDSLKNINLNYERDIEALKRQEELDKKALEDLIRERDILNRNLVKASNNTQKQSGMVKVHEQTQRNLENEIQSYKDEASKQRKVKKEALIKCSLYFNLKRSVTDTLVKQLKSKRIT
jgi:chromosome segregation ATPase